MKELAPKSPAERVPVLFDFTDQFSETEAITTAVVTVRGLRGLDASPSSKLVGSPVILGAAVNQVFNNGVLGEVYELRCVATTNQNQILELIGLQAIRDPSDT